MFTFYQNINARREEAERLAREAELTGHDRFSQIHPGVHMRRKKRGPSNNHRTHSAIEIDDASVRSVLLTYKEKSASIEEDEPSSSLHEDPSTESKSSYYQLTSKIDSLAKILFSRVYAVKGHSNSSNKDNHSNRHSTGSDNISSRWRHCRNNEERWTTTTTNSWLRGHDLTVGLFRPFLRDINYQRRRETTLPYETWHRSNGKQQYTALSQSPRGGGGGGAGGEGAGARGSTSSGITETTERRSRERALSISKFYLQNTQRFVLLKQLNNVGSRVDKHWFAVRDTLLKTDRLLTLAPINRNCTLNICPSTRDVLNKLFLTLQHPYICPILDLDFVQYENQDYVVLVQPINQGSLKDIIYGIERNCWNEDWSYKYGSRGKGLPLQQIQRMGRQILEALVFLKNRDFPTVSHLHSGNVISQNGVARLAALENTLLGFTSRIHPTIASRLHTSCRHPLAPESIDTVCFGHMLFEMTAGYELCTFEPTALNFADIQRYPQVWECLKFIFDQSGGRYPSIEQLILHDLFRNIDLRELRNASVNIFRPDTSTPISKILERIKRQKTPIKRLSEIDSEDMISLSTPESDCSEDDEGLLLSQLNKELSITSV